MLTLELVAEPPDWMGALRDAMARPPGLPERRVGEDPWAAPSTSRPRRVSDDLSWLRAAMDNPRARGLHELGNTSAVASWEFAETNAELRDRFQRLDKRGVLDAVGFFLR